MATLLLRNADGSELPPRNVDLQEIRPGSGRRPSRVPPAELERRGASAARFLELARPHLEWMAGMLADLSPVVALVDADGIVLWSAAPTPERLREAEAEPGCGWSEAAVGPNAVGCALAEGRPVLAVGGPAPDPSWRAFTTLAAPVRRPDGRIAGGLVASVPQAGDRADRLALVSYAASALEQQWTAQERRTAPAADLLTALHEEGLVRRVLDAAPDALVVARRDGTIVFANAQVEKIFGYRKEEVVGRPVELLVPERLRARHEAYRATYMDDPRIREMGQGLDLLARRKDGREIPVEISLSPIRTREGLLVSASIRDVSARREARRRLEIQDAVNRALTESPSFDEAAAQVLRTVARGLGWDVGVLWLLDESGAALAAGQIWARRSFEDSPFVRDTRAARFPIGESLPGRVWKSGRPILIADVAEDARFVRGALATGSGLRSVFGFPVRSGGRLLGVLEFLARGRIAIDDETLRVLGDIGAQVGQVLERRRADAAIRASEARLQHLLREMPLALWTADPRLVVTYCAGRLYGTGPVQRPEAFLGRSLTEIFPADHPALARHREALEGRSGRYTLEIADRAYEASVEPLRDADGRVTSVIGAAVDVTNFKKVEDRIRRLNAELEARVQDRTRALEESLREMGTFTYTVAHDLRAPLRALHGFSDLLVRDYLERPLDAEGRDYLQRIRGAAARMDALILDLLNYSRIGQDQIPLEAIDVRRLAESLLGQMDAELKDRRAEATVEGPPLVARANPFLLEQALANLVSNAVKFVAPSVTPRVRIVVEPHDGRVRVKVVDNGIGVAPEQHERIFGIFQQLNRREDYPGTGIGLALVRRAVEKMGGAAGVESAPGVGSVFWLELPQDGSKF